MNQRGKGNKTLTVLCIFFICFISTQALPADVNTRKPTQSDLYNFSKLFNNDVPIYAVGLLQRSCSKSINGSSIGRNGKEYNCTFSAQKNRLWQKQNHLLATNYSNSKGHSSRMLRECPPVDVSNHRMKQVLLIDGIVAGWIFETTETYCLMPKYTLKANGGCVYKSCIISIPAETEEIFFSPYKEIAENIRKSLKSVTVIDEQDTYPKRSCMDCN